LKFFLMLPKIALSYLKYVYLCFWGPINPNLTWGLELAADFPHQNGDDLYLGPGVMKDDKEVESNKAALAPGEMIPAAGEPREETFHKREAVPYRKLLRWGWYVVSAYLGWFILGVILYLLGQLLTQYNFQVLATMVAGLGGTAAMQKGFLSPLLPDKLETAAIVFAFLTVFLILLSFLNRLSLNWSNNLMSATLQHRLHDKLLDLGPTYHHSHDLGETMLIVTRFSSDTQILLRDVVSFPVVRGIGLITAIIFLTNSFSMMGNPPFSIQATLLATIFILPVGGWWLSLKLRQAYAKMRDSQMAVANEFSNSAALPLEVQLMGAKPQRSQAFGSRLKTYIRDNMAAFLRNEIAFQFQISTPVILQAVFLIYGVFYALQSGNPAAPGAILGIYYFVPEAVNPLQEIIQFFTGLQSSWPQVEKVVEILEVEPEVQEKPGAVALVPQGGTLTVEHLDFAYTPGGPKILDDLSYSFTPGKVTAIVAREGMGKTTLLNLMARLRDPQGGRIFIDGQDISGVTLATLRRHVVKVSQFPLFVADTIRANLKLAKADATDDELEEVCRRTGLWQVLEKATGPHNHPLDYHLPRASSEGLSGGQRRLLAVTRAFLWQPTILLLDEPTTGIDALGRAEVAAFLREICRGLTVLMIDHDLAFICQFADEVCCLEEGKFIEVGSPVELACRPGLFRELLEASKEQHEQEAERLQSCPTLDEGIIHPNSPQTY
jgi:ATP-binding cassette subfamily B protein